MQFSFSQKDSPYKHWEYINQESGDIIRVVPERGGLITSWICNKKEIFYLDEERFQDPSKSVRGGIPILFPICGNLPNNKVVINNKELSIPQHGFARDVCWNLSLLKDEQGINLSLNDNKNSLKYYPFRFQIDLEVRVKENMLDFIILVKNKNKIQMPFSFGLHPYFKVNDLQKVLIKGLPDVCIDQNTMLKDKTSLQLQKLNEGIDFLVEKNNLIELIDYHENHSIQLISQPPFIYNVLWTDPPRKMICLEPWTSPRDSLNSLENILIIEPNMEQKMTCQFVLNKLSLDSQSKLT